MSKEDFPYNRTSVGRLPTPLIGSRIVGTVRKKVKVGCLTKIVVGWKDDTPRFGRNGGRYVPTRPPSTTHKTVSFQTVQGPAHSTAVGPMSPSAPSAKPKVSPLTVAESRSKWNHHHRDSYRSSIFDRDKKFFFFFFSFSKMLILFSFLFFSTFLFSETKFSILTFSELIFVFHHVKGGLFHTTEPALAASLLPSSVRECLVPWEKK